ncbi:MAG: zinc-binding alcohol dehydrogenase [Opitutales bacterium]|nr:zinc-binding alcohol dehydrogenase [Opitutales bacterium]
MMTPPKFPDGLPSRCLLVTGPGKVELGETRIPRPREGEVLIRALRTCISPGTEARVLAGKEPAAPPCPLIPGYAMVGEVVECGSEEPRFAPGTRVFCTGTKRAAHNLWWGGHCEYAVAAINEVVLIPENLDSLQASIAKLMAIAYHGLRLSRPSPHETVFVVGLGPIGRLSAALHAATGARVVAADLHPARRKAARAAGLETVDPGDDLAAAFASVAPGGADIVVEATGVPSVFTACARLLRRLPWDDQPHAGARLVVQATYAENPALPYWDLFDTEATVLVPRDCQLRDLAAVLKLMARGTIDTSGMVGDAGSPSGAARVYAAVRAGEGPFVTSAFDWQA